MKLQLNDVVQVKEDLQFHYPELGMVGKVFKVTTIINDTSVLLQECKISGAVTHSETKRVRNPDLDYREFTDYYDILKTDDPEKLSYERGESAPVGVPMISDEKLKELMAKIESPATIPEPMSGGVWWGPYVDNPLPDSYPFPSPETDPEIFAIDEEESGEIKSDGGSSRYYDIEIPQWLLERIIERNTDEGGAYIKTEEIIEVAFDNDFDFGNLFKSSVRAMGKRKGAGKAGNTLEYECNKMHYSVDKIKVIGSRED